MEHFGHLIHGFDRKDAILSGMETRTSSPLRIKRDESFESNISGVYPCGEGAGYAGGITSAAIDGIKVAEAIIKKYRPDFKIIFTHMNNIYTRKERKYSWQKYHQ